MFGKILKQDLKITGKFIFLGGFILAGAAVVILALSQAFLYLFPLISRVGGFLLALLPVVTAGFVIAFGFIYYQNSMFGKTGYFTMTLPVRPGVLHAAKLTYLTIITAFGIICAGVAALCSNINSRLSAPAPHAETLSEILGELFSGIKDDPMGTLPIVMFILGIIIMMVLSLALAINLGYSGALGPKFYGGGAMVAALVGVWATAQIIMFACTLAIPAIWYYSPTLGFNFVSTEFGMAGITDALTAVTFTNAHLVAPVGLLLGMVLVSVLFVLGIGKTARKVNLFS